MLIPELLLFKLSFSEGELYSGIIVRRAEGLALEEMESMGKAGVCGIIGSPGTPRLRVSWTNWASFSCPPGTPTVCVTVWAVLRLYFDDAG